MKHGIYSVLMVTLAWVVAPSAWAEPSVSRSAYTSGVEDREPVDQLAALPGDAARIYYYTELNDLAGQTVTHRWENGGKAMLEIPFEVKAARWRVWSSKEIHPGVTGEWTVVVVDGNGKELKREILPAAR